MSTDAQTLEVVRRAVRSVVESTPALRQDPGLSRDVANRMVSVSLAAAELIAAEQHLDEAITTRRDEPSDGDEPALAHSLAASDIHGRTAVRSAASTVEALREAIDFPTFVTSLISGVFQSIQNANIQQLQAFSELLEGINSSAAEFGAQHFAPPQAAQWAASRFPGMRVEVIDETEVELVLDDEAEMPDREGLQDALEASAEEIDSIDEFELTETLLPLVQRKLARDRQSLLSTMVMMGLQRVVVDDGYLEASMRLQVDARSIAEQTQYDSVDSRIITEGGASFGVGNWGASAKMTANVGFVHSDERYSREDIAASAGLRSSVNLRFRTLPLDVSRVASDRSLEQIRSRSIVPERERELGSLLTNGPSRVTNAPRPDTRQQTAARHAANRQDQEAAAARRRAQQTAEREAEGQAGETTANRGNVDANTAARGSANANEGTANAGAADANARGNENANANNNAAMRTGT